MGLNRPYPNNVGQMLWEESSKQAEDETAKEAVEWIKRLSATNDTYDKPYNLYAKWLFDNLKPESIPRHKVKKEWNAWVCQHIVDGRLHVFMENCVNGPDWKLIRKISGVEEVEEGLNA